MFKEGEASHQAPPPFLTCCIKRWAVECLALLLNPPAPPEAVLLPFRSPYIAGMKGFAGDPAKAERNDRYRQRAGKQGFGGGS